MPVFSNNEINNINNNFIRLNLNLDYIKGVLNLLLDNERSIITLLLVCLLDDVILKLNNL